MSVDVSRAISRAWYGHTMVPVVCFGMACDVSLRFQVLSMCMLYMQPAYRACTVLHVHLAWAAVGTPRHMSD